ncbi:DNA methyltransferase [Desulfobacterales bacterium HSG2]|nr:DNA methyltransferase [Desulfobacterales bacterium HSG2]
MARKTTTKAKAKKKTEKTIETIKHEDASRKNIPTAEYQSVMRKDEQNPVQVAYERRNQDLDPQLVWRGKDQQDWSDLVVQAPPLYIQDKVHPKFLIDDLLTLRQAQGKEEREQQLGLFSDFNGLPDESARTEFYQHDANWTNRMILGDSLQVMASLAEREGLRGKVQCIYIDPPYGIKFNSNFQWSTTSRDVRDGKLEHITREPEQVKAFRDTWRDGIHSYLTYLRDRLTVARDLLTDSGSVFVQIGDENVHRVRALMDEVFGSENFVSQILYRRGGFQTGQFIANTYDYILWFAKNQENIKVRKSYLQTDLQNWYSKSDKWIEKLDGCRRTYVPLTPLSNNEKLHSDRSCFSGTGGQTSTFGIELENKIIKPPSGRGWSTNKTGVLRLKYANRLMLKGKQARFKPYYNDFPFQHMTNGWFDTIRGGFASDSADKKIYVVQTQTKAIERCILMTTDPGDLVLDPTCGSGTTAYVAEQWGRRWITIDTSRVALALARARIMGARYPYYLLSDSKDGQLKEAEIARKAPSEAPTYGKISQGFVYERVPHITLKAIANNAEIDDIHEEFQKKLEPLRKQLNQSLKKKWEEWEIPREPGEKWAAKVKKLHSQWWKLRMDRQKEIDASIAAKADFEYLYDKPYEDRKKVRVAGPFTVESISPHRVMGVDENDELTDPKDTNPEATDFAEIILENLRTAGVQQAHKEDKISFVSMTPWPGHFICAQGTYIEGSEETGTEKRAAIFIGPEFGTVSRPDLVAAAREAGDGDFDALIACAFSYDAHSSEINKLGRIPILRARMNADLHMAEDLKNTGKGNLFVIFGEPDIRFDKLNDREIRVKINGVDVFHPNTGEIISDGPEGIACWFIDTDYNEESFFVRHAYFLGANDPYKALKTTLKAEISKDAWQTLNSDTSRPFKIPKSGRIAVKVINHLGDEVMKVFSC